LDLIDEGMCFVCGQANPVGLKIHFDVDSDGLVIEGRFVPRPEHQGYKGIMHGGLVSALLDEAMVKLLWDSGIPAVSAALNVKLLRPVAVGKPIVIRGWVDTLKGKVILTGAAIEDERGTLLAEAKGTCMRVPSKEDKGAKKDQ
jgi:uncharacterized protein (TIGR00369 family)